MSKPDDCYCVCHTSLASRAFCEHCKGVNEVSEAIKAKTNNELEKQLMKCASVDLRVVEPNQSTFYIDELLAFITKSQKAYAVEILERISAYLPNGDEVEDYDRSDCLDVMQEIIDALAKELKTLKADEASEAA